MPLDYDYKLTYEKTPFFANETVPELVYKFNSSIKLIVLVRDPVTRVVSAYTHEMLNMRIKNSKKNLTTNISFEEYVFGKRDEFTSNILRRGRYIESYKRWLEYFPKEQILILDGENFINNPFDEIIKMERFLGLKPYFKKKNFIYDESKGFFCLRRSFKSTELDCMDENKGRDHPFVSESSLVKLRNYFTPYDKAFFEFIGEKPFWKI
jgi:hypothetical protein